VPTPDEFLAEHNQEVRKDPAYQEGTAVIADPPGTKGWAMSGFDYVGPPGSFAVCARAFRKVSKKFGLGA